MKNNMFDPYNQDYVKELMEPGANLARVHEKQRIKTRLISGIIFLALLFAIGYSTGISKSDIKYVGNIISMEELGYNETESLIQAAITPLKYGANEVGIEYQMNINDPTIHPDDYFNIRIEIMEILDVSRTDVNKSFNLVFSKDVVDSVKYIKSRNPNAGLEIYTKDSFEEMIDCFTVMDPIKWNADTVYSLHNYDSDDSFPCDHLIYLIKDKTIIKLVIPYDMEVTDERIEVFSNLFNRFDNLANNS